MIIRDKQLYGGKEEIRTKGYQETYIRISD